jgi:hypothetical protein
VRVLQPTDATRRLPAMIASFEDFCLWMYVLIDDFWQQAGAA